MYEKAAEYILRFTAARQGNYFVFFSSYRMLQDVAEVLKKRLGGEETAEEAVPGWIAAEEAMQGCAAAGAPVLCPQKPNMTEAEREEFLAAFPADAAKTRIGLCVLGGVFGEGIDLKGERLIGTVIVGTGLPLVCNERELFRRYYDEKTGEAGSGFARAYLYPGMNKVQQAAGRVIRTMEDKGAVLLLDDRFAGGQYVSLFPREWYPYETVTLASMPLALERFWEKE